ncbi:unnamed protein product [Bursaphelenchus okinawaensis]|uniref:ZP domain-containing protein n=1 Tax=Bursaphelenchus okinawaensis TaxID=465554 RepID=A0A811KG66_9BILA|nr:unnamed protein product [Bursaphelenchus okinawaensis]CAG9102808.1 unnamed protein product [Bursaphelenchus okinawaensis]
MTTNIFSLLFLLLVTQAYGEEFYVQGGVHCDLDYEDNTYTIGRVQIYEHDSLPFDPHDFMGETTLAENSFQRIFFSESEVSGITPLAVVLHDCHPVLRRERNQVRKSGCQAITEFYFQTPEADGDTVELLIDLRDQLPNLICGQNANLISFLNNDDPGDGFNQTDVGSGEFEGSGQE